MKNTNRIYNTIIITIAIMLGITNSNADVHENMVLIPAKDGIDEFYIDKYEVTNAEYKQFIDANPIWQKENVLLSIVGNTYLLGWQGNMYPKGRENHPVINISWYAAKAYAEWAGKDLPTQAQWELAAKGTKQNMKYAWGNTDSKDNANYGRYNPKVSYRIPPTEAVGTYMPNEYGLYDMTGNVEEWCLDRLDVDDIHGRYHIIRGGSWFHSAEELDISRISQHPSNDGMATVGFRCVFVVDGTKTTNVVTDMTSWLSKEMMTSFENTFNSLQKGKISKALFEKKMDHLINYFTGHSLDFEGRLNDEFCKTIAEFNPDFQHEFPFKRTDHRLLLWKYYLEILIEHNDKSLMEILNIYRESLKDNIEDFFVVEGC